MRASALAVTLAAVLGAGACIRWDQELDAYCDGGGGGCAIGGEDAGTDGGTDAGTFTLGEHSGGEQSAQLGTDFPVPLGVQALRDDQPVAGVVVTFVLPDAAISATFPGGVRTAEVTTDQDGVALSPVMTTGTGLGSFDAVATAPGYAPVTFSLSVTERAPAEMELISGAAQVTQVDQALDPLVVRVKDASGAPLEGAAVEFSVPQTGPNAVFSTGAFTVTAVTDANGLASSGPLRAGTLAGAFTITASALQGSAPSVDAQWTVRSEGPATITVVSGDLQFTHFGEAFSEPLVAVLEDRFGNPVEGATMMFTNGSTGAGCVFPSGNGDMNVVSDTEGQVTTQCVTRNVPGDFTVTARIDGIQPIETFFSLRANQIHQWVKVSPDPQFNSGADTYFNPVVVRALDELNNPVPNATVHFSLESETTNPMYFEDSTQEMHEVRSGLNGEASSGGIIQQFDTQGTATVSVSSPAAPVLGSLTFTLEAL